MSAFKENVKRTTTVKVLDRFLPNIIINPDALVKMQIFVENCTEEVGWLGTAYKSEKSNTIMIDDMFLFDQEVHSTTTEITPEGLTTFGEAILAETNGMEIWNNLKVWGHSHVNMTVSPSGQDNSQMETFAEGGHDWFIRIIANKRGEMCLDLYNYEQGIIYNDLPWTESVSAEEMEIEEQIEQLYKFLDAIKKNRMGNFLDDIKEEIKEKVKKKTYTQPNITIIKGTTIPSMSNMKNITQGSEDDKKKINETKSNEKSKYDDNTIETEKDAYYWFDRDVLVDIGNCMKMGEVTEIIEDNGYAGIFSLKEKEIVWKAGKVLASNDYYLNKL